MSPAESQTSSYGLTTKPQRRLDVRSKQVAEICHDLARRGFSEAHVNACARIFVQRGQMSHHTEVVCSPRGVESDGQAGGVQANRTPYIDNRPVGEPSSLGLSGMFLQPP